MAINTHATQTFQRWQPKVYGHQYCQHITYANGKARMCEEPSHGRTYCKTCAPGGALIATDRKLTDAQVTDEKHPWRKPMKL